MNPEHRVDYHENDYPSNWNLRSCYTPWEHIVDRHVTLKANAPLRVGSSQLGALGQCRCSIWGITGAFQSAGRFDSPRVLCADAQELIFPNWPIPKFVLTHKTWIPCPLFFSFLFWYLGLHLQGNRHQYLARNVKNERKEFIYNIATYTQKRAKRLCKPSIYTRIHVSFWVVGSL